MSERRYSLSVPYRAIKALMMFCAQRDIRYYLNGVCIDFKDPSNPVAVATDGHRMLTIRLSEYGDPSVEQVGDLPSECSVIIPFGLLKSFKPTKIGKRFRDVRVVFEGFKPFSQDKPDHGIFKRVTLDAGCDISPSANTVEGAYPNWRSVAPNTDGLKMMPPDLRSFNLGYVAEALDALITLEICCPSQQLWPAGTGCYMPPEEAQNFSLDDMRQFGNSGNINSKLMMKPNKGVQFIIMPRRI